MYKLVCGADVCKNSIVCCFLSARPQEKLSIYLKNKSNFHTFKPNKDDVKRFLGFNPSHIVLEPTGTNYAWIWAEICQQNGIEILWVPNNKCGNCRSSIGIRSKTDEADALTLALIPFGEAVIEDPYITYHHNDGLSQLRNLVLEHEHLIRAQSPLINRLRQQLAREFPEVALTQSKKASDGLVPLWAWLAQVDRNLDRESNFYETKWTESIAQDLVLEISDFTRNLARMVQELELEQQRILKQMRRELSRDVFANYYRVLNSFELNDKTICLIISLVYPIERFFNGDGMRRGRSRFKQRLGLGKVEENSGDSRQQKASGSWLARKFLNLFVHQRVDTTKRYSCTRQMDELQSYFDQLARKWNSDPNAIADRERSSAAQKARKAVGDELSGLVSTTKLNQIKKNLVASIEAEEITIPNNWDAKKRCRKLLNSRTAAKLVENIWTALLDEFYPKPEKTGK